MESLLLRVHYGLRTRCKPNVSCLYAPDLAAVLLVVLLPDLAITVKRWHDRDKSAWWLLLNVPLVIGRMSMPFASAEIATQASMTESLVSLVALVCGSWILVECGFMKGTQSRNRYGPEPE